MFPFNWQNRPWMGVPNNSDQFMQPMWNSGCDSGQSLAQSQAQIQALQQQNAALNQQLSNQTMTHLNNLQHLQQLISQQSSTPPPHPSPAPASAVPNPVTSTTPPAPPQARSTNPPPFNPDEMIEKLRSSTKADLDELMKP